ncbi:uncharacterized protein LOC129753418 [Uranotaenia lowii]|uniref:uncharacterized protein LOC129753418 n=1 Tax=Uranotaenia lowii TaxID=190385 RepID=UPI002478B60A|nr:uncharacterized protein LOC129753418 [Uranotaenia lowii]
MAESFPPWGGLPGPSHKNSRTIPSWMDPDNLHGQVQFLVLKPTNQTKLPQNPFVIAKSIDRIAGRIDGASPTDGGKSILLAVRSQKQSDQLLQLKELIDGTPVNVELHPTRNTSQCVVSCREVADLKDTEICQALEDQDVVKVYRFTRKVEGKTLPTNTMVLTFKGTVPPTHVWFGYLRVPTRPYYPRPMQCFACGRFGHTKTKCPNNPICPNCGDNTLHPECPNPSYCVNCQGNHCTSNRICPAYQHKQNIVRIRVDMGIPHSDAVKEYRSRLNSASHSRVQQRLLNPLPSAQDNDKIKALEKKTADLLEQNAQLLAKITAIENSQNDDSDTTLTDTNSEASMDTTDDSPIRNSTPKRGRGTESPGNISPARQTKSLKSTSQPGPPIYASQSNSKESSRLPPPGINR